MRARATLACVAFVATAMSARAQSIPLERKVSVPIADISLREALDRVALAARVRFSYASEALPLERSVRVPSDSMTVAELLEKLLRGIAVTPVVAGPNQIVLVESRAAVRASSGERTLPPTELSRVIVTGTPAGGIPRPLSVSLTTIGRDELMRTNSMNIADILDAGAPGMWVWESAATSGLARYGSVRGASSLGTTYPKVYIDGVSVANPLLLTTLDPEGIDRIEVIRGPQGAALYGSDAISGVINIITRFENPSGGLSRVRMRSIAGVANSDYANPGLAQNHYLSIVGGSAFRSGQIGLGISSMGDYYENAASRHFSANGAFREIRSNVVITGTARVSNTSNGLPVTARPDSVTRVADLLDRPVGATSAIIDSSYAARDLSLTAYTAGVNARLTSGDRWTHTLVLGVDGYRMRNFANEFTPFPSSTDSALRAARGGGDRTTARATSALKLGDTRTRGATISLVLEHSALRQESPLVRLGQRVGPGAANAGPLPDPATRVDWLSDVGMSTQVDLGFADKFFICGGLRLERNEGYVSVPRSTVLPMIGASYLRDVGGVTLKWRAAYGSGIRAPRTAARETMMGGMRAYESLRELGPERQSGVEAGFDVFVGRVLSLGVTGFDQHASGLIQQVVVPDSVYTPQGVQQRLTLYYQNVGAIANRGIEVQATARHGRLSFKGSFSAVSSTVQSVANQYTGELRAGDRVLGVPSRTASAAVAWTSSKWNATIGLTRAYDWMEYDRLALAQAYSYVDRRVDTLYGADLRGYWRNYEGNTRVKASVSRVFGRSVTGILSGENLLGGQRGEPDNATIVPGRTFSVGWRISLF